MPAWVFQVDEADPREGRLFTPAYHVGGEDGQLALPGVGVDRLGAVTPALPVAWYDLGRGDISRGRGAPLALRLMVMALRALPLDDRDGQPRRIDFTLRDFKRVFAPGRYRSARQMRDSVERGAAALDSIEARLPTDSGLWRLVDVRRLPRWDVAPDDVLTLEVSLPPGVVKGPPLPAQLDEYGVISGPAYRATLNTAAHLWQPGRTHAPTRGKRAHWARVYDPNRYPVLTDADAVALVFPAGVPTARRRDYAARAWRVLRDLDKDGVIHLGGRRVLPPPSGAEVSIWCGVLRLKLPDFVAALRQKRRPLPLHLVRVGRGRAAGGGDRRRLPESNPITWRMKGDRQMARRRKRSQPLGGRSTWSVRARRGLAGTRIMTCGCKGHTSTETAMTIKTT